jgi:hypothetical protein
MRCDRGYVQINSHIAECVSIELFRRVLAKQALADITLSLSQVLKKFSIGRVP